MGIKISLKDYLKRKPINPKRLTKNLGLKNQELILLKEGKNLRNLIGLKSPIMKPDLLKKYQLAISVESRDTIAQIVEFNKRSLN